MDTNKAPELYGVTYDPNRPHFSLVASCDQSTVVAISNGGYDSAIGAVTRLPNANTIAGAYRQTRS